MQIHGTTHVHGPQPINAPHRTQAPQPAAQSGYATGADQLDISREADMVSRACGTFPTSGPTEWRRSARRSKRGRTRPPRSSMSPWAVCWTKSASDVGAPLRADPAHLARMDGKLGRDYNHPIEVFFIFATGTGGSKQLGLLISRAGEPPQLTGCCTHCRTQCSTPQRDLADHHVQGPSS